jgi:thioredoxin-related protein
MEPIVNGIRREYRGKLGVVYADVDTSDGKELARQYGAFGTPTFVLLDSQGEQVQVLRGSFPASLIVQAIEDVLAQ